jgi:RNA polymerase sigma factor (sigma-70 family)
MDYIHRLRDFYQTIDHFEGDHVFFVTVPRLWRAIEAIREKLQLAPEKAETAGAIAGYLWLRLQTIPVNPKVVELWQVFLLNRAVRVVERIYPPNAPRFDGDLESAYNKLLGRRRLSHPSHFFSRFTISAEHPAFLPILIDWTDRSLRYSLWDALAAACPGIGDSDLSVVLKSSESCIRNALKTTGLDSDLLDLVVCFQEVHSCLKIAINHWTDTEFQIVADRHAANPPLTSESVQDILTEIGRAIRQCNSPPFYPIDPPIGENGEEIDLFSGIADPFSDASHFLHQQQERLRAFQSCIDSVVNALNEERRQIFYLYFIERRNQAEIASAMGLSPSHVSHQLTWIYNKIFFVFREWILEINPYLEIGDELTSRFRTEIKKYLRGYYAYEEPPESE